MTSKHDLYTAPPHPLPLCRVPCLFRIWRANCRPVDWQQRALMSLALARNYLKTFPFKVNNLSRVFLQPAAADNKLLGGASSGTERNGTKRNRKQISRAWQLTFMQTCLSWRRCLQQQQQLATFSRTVCPASPSIRLSFHLPLFPQPRPAPAHQRIGKEGSALVCCPAFCPLLAP